MKRTLMIIPLMFLVFNTFNLGWAQETFVVLGKSEKAEDLPPPTIEIAVRDGLKRAVEEAVRGMVTFQTLEEQHETLAEGLYNKPESFVLSYKILEEATLPSGYQVLLEVLVDTKGVKRKLESLGLLEQEEVRPFLREVKFIVAGVKSYGVFLEVEKFLKKEAEVQSFTIAEIEPNKFTWKLTIKGGTDRLAGKLLRHDFGVLKVKVVTLTPEELGVELSNYSPSGQGGG